MKKNIKLTPQTALFLDRDGVINKRKIGGYILSVKEFQFIDGVLPAMEIFNQYFSEIFVVTNQQGIGKGVMSEEDFSLISDFMLKEITFAHGRIDKIYHCPNLKTDNSPNRKPNIGMAVTAQEDFPQISLNDSVMVGDSMSDMMFGKNAGMFTVFIDNKTENNINYDFIDMTFPNLISFAEYIKERF